MSDKPTPNFLVIGANKAGTSSMHSYLQSHPQIFMSRIKEPFFYNPRPLSRDYLDRWCNGATDRAELLEFMLEGYNGEKIFGESSTTYSHQLNGDCARYIHAERPDVKMVYILRHPLGRLVSRFLYLNTLGWVESDFNTELRKNHQYLLGSLYFQQLSYFLDYFDPARIKCLIFEEVVEDTQAALDEIFAFLGIPPHTVPDDRLVTHNKSKNRKTFDRAQLKFSRDSFDRLMQPIGPDVAAMSEFLGRDLTATWNLDAEHWVERG